MPLRLAVLLSGSGTTLENLIEHQAKGLLDVEFAVVVSSKPTAFGLERARRHGIPAHAVDRKAYRDEHTFNNALHRLLDEYHPDLVILAGFLSRLELRAYNGRTMNIHPALIPAFYDTGPIILQEAVPVEDDDTVDSLARRVQEKERELYPRAIQLFAEGRLQVEGRHVRVLPS
jgi:phosphoribosylglycinamide formyltransferase-1